MNSKDLLARIGVVVAIVIAIIGIVTPVGQAVVQTTTHAAGNILDTDYFDLYQATTGFQLGNARAGTLNTGGGVVSCGNTTSVALVSGTLPATCTITSTGASSTVVAIGPFTASSTLTRIFIQGLQGATTTDIVIGTSTTPSVLASSTLAENIAGLFSVSNGSQFFSIAGDLLGSAKGYNSPAGGTYRTNGSVGVGIGEYLLIFSTSTATGGTNGGLGATQVAVPASIIVKYEYQN